MKIIDFHCDTISRIMNGDAAGLGRNNLSVDVEKLVDGQIMAQFFAMYVDMKAVDDPFRYCLKMIDCFYNEIEANEEKIAVARSGLDLKNIHNSGKIAAFLAIEEGGVLQGEIDNLRNLYRLGTRLITLTWNYPNEIGFPNYAGTYQDRGLTEFGRAVVVEMNRLGMLIDVSHLSDQGFYDVAVLSEKPFVASHSNSRFVTNHMRNLTDDMIRLLAEKGGILGINFASDFLGTSEISRVEDMIRHILHIRNVGGIDVVAVGSDFDGIGSAVEIEHAGKMQKLIIALEQAGFSLEEVEKICHKNALRVINDCL